MQTFRTTIRKNRKGNVFKVVSEHYLRDDVYCGCKLCTVCPQEPSSVNVPCSAVESVQTQLNALLQSKDMSSFVINAPADGSSVPVIVIPDYSVFSTQMDLLETRSAPFGNVVVLQSVLEDARRRHYKTYQRIRSFCKTTDTDVSSVHVFPNLHHRSTYVESTELPLKTRLDLAASHLKSSASGSSSASDLDSDDSDQSESENDDSDPLVRRVNYTDLTASSSSTTLSKDASTGAASTSTSTSTSPSSSVAAASGTPSATAAMTMREENALLARASKIAAQEELQVVSAARWYQRHLHQTVAVVLLTNDPVVASTALRQGVLAVSVEDYTNAMIAKYPQLEDVLAKTVQESLARIRGQWTYEPHLSTEEMQLAVLTGQLLKGTFEVNRDYWAEAMVTVPGYGRVHVPDFKAMNRAIHGDVVVVQLLPNSEWKVPSQALPSEDLAVDGLVEKEVEAQLEAEEMAEKSAKIDDGYMPSVDDDDWAGAGEGADGDEAKAQQAKRAAAQKKKKKEEAAAAAAAAAAKLKAGGGDPVPTGKVVGIWTRNTKPYCGSIEETDKHEGSVFFLPVNKRIPKILIRSSRIESLLDKRVMVSFDSWPVSSRHPLGHIVRTLGTMGDHATETEVLLTEHDVKHDPWTAAVKACLPPLDYQISEEERKDRVDLRDVLIFSIDPPGCTDIDDALHCIDLGDGTYEVGVHIADVTHYVLPGTALDEEAAQRSTSVYLVDRRIDMIPARLSTNICSLRGGEERLAFSCVWRVNDKAEILETKFFKSLIKSKAAWTYAMAQERIDLPDSPDNDEMTMACKNMNKLALALKRRRNREGALTLASAEVKFVLDKESRMPTDVAMYQMKQANSLVEEFMLLANVSVAEHVLRAFPTFALLRRHPVPSPDMLEPLVKAAKSLGFDIDISSGRALSESLDRVVRPEDPQFNKIVRMMTTRCLTQAVYVSAGETSPKNYFHFGLAMNTYTHFTSPIRRYSDIVVHRLLATSIGISPLPPSIRDRAAMRDVVDNLNHRHRMAQLASRASSEVFTLLFFKGKDVVVDALVLAVKTTGVRVMVPTYGIECVIRIVPRPDTASSAQRASLFKYDADALSLSCVGRGSSASDTKAHIGMFDRVQVRITTKENKMRRSWLSVELVGPLRDEFDKAQGLTPYSMLNEADRHKKAMEQAMDEDVHGEQGEDAEKEEEEEEAKKDKVGGMVDKDEESKASTSASTSSTKASKTSKTSKSGKQQQATGAIITNTLTDREIEQETKEIICKSLAQSVTDSETLTIDTATSSASSASSSSTASSSASTSSSLSESQGRKSRQGKVMEDSSVSLACAIKKEPSSISSASSTTAAASAAGLKSSGKSAPATSSVRKAGDDAKDAEKVKKHKGKNL